MRKITFNLYLDESGNFQDDPLLLNQTPSLVGGLLWQGAADPEEILSDIPNAVHAMVHYDKELFFRLLNEMSTKGGRFVIFENTERISVVNGDVTYLNIISEGIVKLLQALAVSFPDDQVTLQILIAKRKDVDTSERTGISRVIPEADYIERLEEKLMLAMGRQKIGGTTPVIEMGDARYDKRLMLADIICNTYLTRRAVRKFTDSERIWIQNLFSKAYIFPVFDNATVGFIRRLLIDGRYEEMMYQICVLRSLAGVTVLRNKLIERIQTLAFNEQKAIFSYMSLQIRQYNSRRMFQDGIQFAENYKSWILEVLEKDASRYSGLGQELPYWQFDTDFYILTMYDHLGNALKCNEYLKRCHSNIDTVCTSWEHIDFYFQFKIRELNCLMGQFEFEKVAAKAAEMIVVLKNAKELFSMIGSYEGADIEVSSELLGKVNGVRLEALINLVHKQPELFSEALQASDDALDEFIRPQDLQRQWQYRSMLMVETSKTDDALSCLFKSYGLDANDDSVFETFLNQAFSGQRIDLFSLFHYTNVLLLLCRNKDPRAEKMGNMLFKNRSFNNAMKDSSCFGHPWNLILWNISKICRLKGKHPLADSMYQKAKELTIEHRENATMLSFAVSMGADRILQHYCEKTNPADAIKDYLKIYNLFSGASTPENILKHFPSGTTPDILREVASGYLR